MIKRVEVKYVESSEMEIFIKSGVKLGWVKKGMRAGFQRRSVPPTNKSKREPSSHKTRATNVSKTFRRQRFWEPALEEQKNAPAVKQKELAHRRENALVGEEFQRLPV